MFKLIADRIMALAVVTSYKIGYGIGYGRGYSKATGKSGFFKGLKAGLGIKDQSINVGPIIMNVSMGDWHKIKEQYDTSTSSSFWIWADHDGQL